jgi:hypothetical protein
MRPEWIAVDLTVLPVLRHLPAVMVCRMAVKQEWIAVDLIAPHVVVEVALMRSSIPTISKVGSEYGMMVEVIAL